MFDPIQCRDILNDAQERATHQASKVEMEIIAKGIGKQSRQYQHQFVSQ